MKFLRLVWKPVRLLWGRSRLRPDFVNLFLSKGIKTFHIRPKRSKDLFVGVGLYPEVGIVMQGPLMKKYNFTYETLKLYKKMWPDSQIVFSTWTSENRDEIQRIKALGVLVVQSEKPQAHGISNVNLQNISAFQGIEKLSKAAKYVLKTRSDQRISNPFSISLMLRELDGSGYLKESSPKLVVASFDSFSNREWGLSDFLSFSTVPTAAIYWAPLENREMGQSSDQRTPEQLLSMRYARFVLGPTVGWEVALRNLYAIVDGSSLDLLWPKYSAREYRWRNYTKSGLRELSAGEWHYLRDKI